MQLVLIIFSYALGRVGRAQVVFWLAHFKLSRHDISFTSLGGSQLLWLLN
jgi:hypothetical protein